MVFGLPCCPYGKAQKDYSGYVFRPRSRGGNNFQNLVNLNPAFW